MNILQNITDIAEKLKTNVYVKNAEVVDGDWLELKVTFRHNNKELLFRTTGEVFITAVDKAYEITEIEYHDEEKKNIINDVHDLIEKLASNQFKEIVIRCGKHVVRKELLVDYGSRNFPWIAKANLKDALLFRLCKTTSEEVLPEKLGSDSYS